MRPLERENVEQATFGMAKFGTTKKVVPNCAMVLQGPKPFVWVSF